jgi:hypothetical protein
VTAGQDAWAAYAEAVLYLDTPSGTVRVRPGPLGLTMGVFPGQQGQILHVITAHNPSGVVHAPADNAAAQARLEAELSRRELPWWQAAGGDPGWTHVEASAAVFGLDREAAIALGQQYGQDAVFELTPTFRAVVDCDTGRTLTTGWQIEALQDGHPETGRAAGGRQPTDSTGQIPPLAEAAGAERGQTAPRPPYPPDWLGQDGYLTQLARREGLLMSLSFEGASVAVHGSGDGTVSITGPGGKTSGYCGPAEALAALWEQSALAGDTDYQSGSWDAGEIAALIAPWLKLDGGGEFYVDDILMCTDGHGHPVPGDPAQAEALTLSYNSWELEGGGGSPGNADDGSDYLLRIGPRYVVIQCAGGDQVTEEVEARSDEEAIERFQNFIA